METDNEWLVFTPNDYCDKNSDGGIEHTWHKLHNERYVCLSCGVTKGLIIL